MLADAIDQAFTAEIAHYEPELQRAKTSPELNAVVHSVFHATLVTRFQILWDERERFLHLTQIPAIKDRKIERREQPLVRISHDRVSTRAAFEVMLELGNYRG